MTFLFYKSIQILSVLCRASLAALSPLDTFLPAVSMEIYVSLSEHLSETLQDWENTFTRPKPCFVRSVITLTF